MKIDLHMHSTCSDGTDSPAQLVARAKAAHIDVMGITDHDTVRGWKPASEAAVAQGISLVRGMEVTASYAGARVHILAYLFDPTHPAVTTHIERVQAGRIDRAREITARLAADYPITFADVEAQAAPGATLGRPHIADALVAKNIIANRSEAFATLLASTSPYYVSQYAPQATDVVTFIRDAGGKTVWAHPWAVSRGKVAPLEAFAVLAGAGLFGVEVDHRDNPVDTREALADIVKKHGLARFGSSDFHGRGKPNQLAEHTTAADVYHELIEDTFGEVI